MTNIISWNVNSIKTLINHINLQQFLKNYNVDIFCMTETKLSNPDIIAQYNFKKLIKGYQYRFYNTSISKKGYSGTAIWSKIKPLNEEYGLNIDDLDKEGRLLTLEFNDYYLINVYTPNSSTALKRLKYRVDEWDKSFWNFVKEKQKIKPVIVCGDLNVARYEIDIHNPKNNLKSAGFTIDERNSINNYLKKLEIIDVFRHFNPDKIQYSYWSYMNKARQNNKGWRLDYFLITSLLVNKVNDIQILENEKGSDHAPLLLSINI